jgi:hypothetical protein
MLLRRTSRLLQNSPEFREPLVQPSFLQPSAESSKARSARSSKTLSAKHGLRFAATALAILLSSAAALCADGPGFDLIGPKIDVHVQRDGRTLPIAEVPNLMPGDRLWIHPDLPASQSAHYVLIVAFLRGSTNPPPTDWFKRVETWTREAREEGVFTVVPAEAQQALLFLAPETTGDFSTLRKAVQGRPGAFVRATQDLQQASWDRLRLDSYLAEIKEVATTDPKILKEHTETAAHELGIKVDQQCFDKPAEQQASCLMQHTEGLVLDDSNAQSMVNQMVNGSASDMMNQLSYSALGGAGQFSPYVGAVVDLARILSSLHTAKFQYIPALALPTRDNRETLNLRLNVPPSFRDPKSVIVVALPPVGPGKHPILHANDANQAYCAPKPELVMQSDGAPLVFGSAMAHDLILHVETKATMPAAVEPHTELKPAETAQTPEASSPAPPTKPKAPADNGLSVKPAVVPEKADGIDVAVHADPSSGGFVLDHPLPALPEDEVVAELRGEWGFDPLTGPKFHLRAPHPGGWSISPGDLNALITGREDMLHIQGASTLCVQDVQATLPSKDEAKPVKVNWKSPKPDLLEVGVPLKDAKPGTVTIAIHQYGLEKPELLPLKSYAEAAAIEHLTLSAGDKVAVLKGKRLDEVESADLAGISFAPAALNRIEDFDQLDMSATGVTSTLQPGNSYSAKVTLRDGRTLHVPATVSVSRPQVDLLSKGVQHDEGDADTGPQIFHLGSPNDLPLQRKLVFFLKSKVPATFARTEKVELAAEDGSFGTTLSLTDGSLMLEDAHTAVAVLDPLARFGASAFGPVRLRAITADGVTGDWVPLGTLVRLPGFPATNALRCPRNPAKPCQLTGSNLFLITGVGATQDMNNAVDVPPEFTGNTLTVPNTAKAVGNAAANPAPVVAGPTGLSGTLYVRLRDDPGTVQMLNLPVTSAGPSTAGSYAPSPTAAPATGDAGSASAKPETPANQTLLDPSGPATASSGSPSSGASNQPKLPK